ncbi:ABC transporter ATP-binding protein [Halotia wernerae UHCC 0503]|nr:ABC transporter ATP-binding protein [Halotia wernerae UHCC 0503]
MTDPVLRVDGLTIALGSVKLVEDLSFDIMPGEAFGLVGESGCGKSVTALSILRLIASPPLAITGGRIEFGGRDLLKLSEAEIRGVRGGEIAMIFQEPMTSLNPVFTIGDQIGEALAIHRSMSARAAASRAAELLDLVGIPAARAQLERYPHQLSGGQRQRAMIAMALACEPKLLIADEPTTALDVTVQAQILALIERLRREFGLACLLITHDLGVVGETCARVAVMYAGRIVEHGPTAEVFGRPRHRYTKALLETIPAANPPGKRLPAIPGNVPAPGRRGSGCTFAERCAAPLARCSGERPQLVRAGEHGVACWNPAP